MIDENLLLTQYEDQALIILTNQAQNDRAIKERKIMH